MADDLSAVQRRRPVHRRKQWEYGATKTVPEATAAATLPWGDTTSDLRPSEHQVLAGSPNSGYFGAPQRLLWCAAVLAPDCFSGTSTRVIQSGRPQSRGASAQPRQNHNMSRTTTCGLQPPCESSATPQVQHSIRFRAPVEYLFWEYDRVQGGAEGTTNPKEEEGKAAPPKGGMGKTAPAPREEMHHHPLLGCCCSLPLSFGWWCLLPLSSLLWVALLPLLLLLTWCNMCSSVRLCQLDYFFFLEEGTTTPRRRERPDPQEEEEGATSPNKEEGKAAPPKREREKAALPRKREEGGSKRGSPPLSPSPQRSRGKEHHPKRGGESSSTKGRERSTTPKKDENAGPPKAAPATRGD